MLRLLPVPRSLAPHQSVLWLILNMRVVQSDDGQLICR